MYILFPYSILAVNLPVGKDVRAFIEIGDKQLFSLDKSDLSPLSKYEIRISHLGTFGASFSIAWSCPSRSSRRLLDTEKLVFSTDHSGAIRENCYEVSVSVLRNSRGRNLEASSLPVWFVIKLEQYDGILPHSVVPMTVGILISLICSGLLFAYFLSARFRKPNKSLINKEN
jgi:hypothetical protein